MRLHVSVNLFHGWTSWTSHLAVGDGEIAVFGVYTAETQTAMPALTPDRPNIDRF